MGVYEVEVLLKHTNLVLAAAMMKLVFNRNLGESDRLDYTTVI